MPLLEAYPATNDAIDYIDHTIVGHLTGDVHITEGRVTVGIFLPNDGKLQNWKKIGPLSGQRGFRVSIIDDGEGTLYLNGTVTGRVQIPPDKKILVRYTGADDNAQNWVVRK